MGRDSVTSTQQVTELDRNDWKPGDRATERPREFRVTPSSGTIRVQSQIDVKVGLFYRSSFDPSVHPPTANVTQIRIDFTMQRLP